MEIKPKVKKFQMGGEMPPAQDPAMAADQPVAPDQAAGQDPIMMLAEMAAQALQSGDCDAAMAVCDGFMQLVQAASQGAPADAAPQGEPVFKRGGKLARRINK